jgi:HK97 family phage major capsid protein
MPYNSLIDRTNDAAALIPEDVASGIVQAAPTASAVMALSRRVTMSRAQQRIPCLSAFPSAYWVNGDTGLKQTTAQAWTNKYLNAEELAVIVPIPEALLDDAGYDIWGEIKPRIVEAFGAAIDAAVLFGDSKPASWPDDILQDCTDAGSTVSLATKADIVEAIGGETNGLMSLVEADGFDVNGFVGHISIKGYLRNARTGDGALIYQPSVQVATPSALYGQRLQFLVNGAFDSAQALLFGGDWSQSMIAVRQDMTYKILTEAVIQGADGGIVYNLAQQDMVALRCVMRVAWQVANPITKLNSASQYPFAALTA